MEILVIYVVQGAKREIELVNKVVVRELTRTIDTYKNCYEQLCRSRVWNEIALCLFTY